MSVVRVVDAGEAAFFTAYFAVAAIGGGHDLHLFTNDVEDGLTTGQLEALTEADFDEATFAGYAAVNLTGGSWTVTESDPTFATYAQQTFTRSSTGTAELVRGYYVTATSDDSLQWYEQFDGPITIEFEDDALRVTPRLTLEDTAVIPVGTIVPYGGSGVPSGWQACDGSAVSRTTFAALFAVLGETYGAGNGSTTFNLPDLRQRFPMGVAASGTGNALGDTGGAIDHTHALDTSTSFAAVTTTGGLVGFDRKDVNWTNDTTFTATGGASNVASNNRTNAARLGGSTDTANPPFLAVGFIIKSA